MKNKMLISLLLMSVAFTGCVSVQNDWERTQSINTVESYRGFLARHPGSEFEDEANANQAMLAHEAEMLAHEADWNEAIKSDSLPGYRDFLRKHPNSPYKTGANVGLLRTSLKVMNVEGVQAALEAGANPNHRFDENLTPLIYIAKSEVARVTHDGLTLHLMKHGMQIKERRAIAKLLIDSGASTDSKDASNKTALDYLLSAKPSQDVIVIQMVTASKTDATVIKKEVDPGLMKLFQN
jgi:hypothetical protein